MRTGLFGGTFNPVHSGHIKIITDLLASFPLDKIIVVPAAAPPHKASEFMADISLRLEMTRLAFTGLPQCCVSDIESNRPGRSYTIDTVECFLTTAAPGTEFFLILGLDSFLELDTWKRHMSLIEKVPFIVINRPLSRQSEKDAFDSFLSLKISAAYTFSPAKNCYLHQTLKPIFFHKTPAVYISSSEIRRRLKNGQSVRSLLPETVEQFIKKRGLYK